MTMNDRTEQKEACHKSCNHAINRKCLLMTTDHNIFEEQQIPDTGSHKELSKAEGTPHTVLNVSYGNWNASSLQPKEGVSLSQQT